MNRNLVSKLCFSAIIAAMPTGVMATTFFTDNFSNGSTLTNSAPANPTANSTAYQLVSSKSWVGCSLAANDLKFGIAATTSGSTEVQALFSTNPVALTANGDYIQLTVTFTNTSGLLTQASSLGFGLYGSGSVNGITKPVTNGLNGNATSANTTAVTGAAQNWQGYVGQIGFNAGSHRIMTRAAQTGAGNNNQEAVTSGSGTSSYANPAAATVGATTASTLTLTAGATYTEVLIITLLTNDFNSLAITNTLYAGTGTGGIVLTNFGGIATNATLLTSGFDSLAIGWRETGNQATTIEISSIKVEGVATPVATAPIITTQPVPVTVATGGSSIYNVVATGVNLTYQWHRHGTNLLNGGNISGVPSSTLIINNASAADVATSANGYYVTVSGAGGFSVNSTTNALTLGTAKNLVWAGAGSAWDLNTSANFLDPVNPATFNYGDAVTFNDVGAANSAVTLTGSFLSASSVTIDGSTVYNFSGTGSFAGTGSLIYKGSGFTSINNPNTYSGGTVISNASAYLDLKNVNGLGTGPLTLALAGGKIEVEPTASASTGFNGNVIVNDDFTIQFDGTGQFAGVFLGDISGTANKVLTLTPKSPYAAGQIRFRAYGTNTVCNSDIMLAGNTSDQAQYYGTTFAYYGGSGSQTYNGVISGDGGIITRGNGTMYLNGINTYAGGTTLTSGALGAGNDNALGAGPLNLAPENGGTTGSGTIFASGGARTIANTVQYPSGTNNSTLIIGGTNNITFTSPINLAGVDGSSTSNRTFTVNNTGATTLSGIISDGGNAIGFVKNGTNTLYLNKANTYSGLTTVSAGVLAGSGSIAGSVIVTTNASIGGGAASSLGTLAVGGDLTLTNGGGFFRVNRSGSQSDLISVSGVLTNTGNGKITVTNLGSVLQVGDTFTLFNKAVVGGASMVVTGGGASWTNRLAVNGTIQVIPSVNTNPTNITASVIGNVLTLSWPADHTGWRLQVQTNTLANGLNPASAAWSTVSGSTNVSSTAININPANGSVFYRLIYP